MGYVKGEPWDDEDLALLDDMREAGMTVKQIAAALERTVTAVQNKVCEVYLRQPRYRPPPLLKDAMALMAMRRPWTAISQSEEVN